MSECAPNKIGENIGGGLNRTADKIRDQLDDIAAELDGGSVPRSRRSELNKLRWRLLQVLQWCETRAGYAAAGND